MTDSEVKAGQILQGVVRKIDKTRKIVYLNSDADIVSKCVVCFSSSLFFFVLPFCISVLLTFCFCNLQMKDLRGISIDLLVPGMMVSARVQATLENGIMLSFLTYFTGTVSCYILVI